MYLSFQFQMNTKERILDEFEMGVKKSLSWSSSLSNDDMIS